jgi:ribosomal protein S18 acetylase RimI-like enzyme
MFATRSLTDSAVMHIATPSRAATEADLAGIARTIGRAFADDPLTSWLLPNPTDRDRRLESFHGKVLAATWDSHRGEVLTTEGQTGVAIWRAPNEWKAPARVTLRVTIAALRSWGTPAVVRGAKLLGALEKRHPAEEHWYLDALATDPAFQRRGIGSALLAPALQRCDLQGLPAYLETQKPENVAFYRHFGFEVREELEIVTGGPRVWTMWREAQS